MTEAEKLALADCPIGLFISEGGELCLKTEYGTNEGRIDAYIVSSGEFFWGGASRPAEQRKVLVQPISVSALRSRVPSEAVQMIKEIVDDCDPDDPPWAHPEEGRFNVGTRARAVLQLLTGNLLHPVPVDAPGRGQFVAGWLEGREAAARLCREAADEQSSASRGAMAEELRDAILALPPPEAPQGEGKRWRHVRRGSTYRVLHEATMQEAGPLDDRPMVVYQCETDGRVWVRPKTEFEDGRFEPLPDSPKDRG